MSSQAKTYGSNLNFIKTLAEIAEPFNSTLLDGYSEYEEHNAEYEISDTKECFLSILNKVGEDGCQVLTDRVVNYIDDVSNIDTTIPSALLSQAESLGYPYKDKKIVEQLTRLTKCSPLLQSLVWASSTNARNSRIILKRLNIIDDKQFDQLSSTYSIDDLQNEVESDISSMLLDKVFDKHYLYLDAQNNVSAKDSPSILDFSWIVNSIFSDEIIKSGQAISDFGTNVIDFGKYNMTIYSIVCRDYFYAHAGDLKKTQYDDNQISKTLMPFLFDNDKFDPIQAAWSIIYDAKTLSDYDERYHEMIEEFMKLFNEKLNVIAYDAVINFLRTSELKSKNTNFAFRLNANSFSYQQLACKMISDVKTLFAIDIKDYLTDDKYINRLFGKNSGYFSYINNPGKGFAYLDSDLEPDFSLSSVLDFDKYINAIVSKIFDLGKKIRNLREDLRLMTLRNSYKGTSTLIQFATIEYLRDCIGDLLHNAQEQYNNDHPSEKAEISSSIVQNIENELANSDQSSIGVKEYWDYTEYFNRNTNTEVKSSSQVDWLSNPLVSNDWKMYGSMLENEIFNFYSNALQLPKEVYDRLDENGKKINENSLLRNFLRLVYNSGVFTERTNDNYEAVYSGNINETTNPSPWIPWKNKDFISKQIHPYIWNFTDRYVSRIYQSNVVTVAIQNTEYTLLHDCIHELGNIVDQFRLSENFVDSSGYVTRYENRDHAKKEVTQSYDGIIYPKFAFDLISGEITENNVEENWTTELSIYNRWYLNQNIKLSEYAAKREIKNLEKLVNDTNFKKSVNATTDATSMSVALQNYCIDKYETTYGVLNNRPVYKENGFPFMRPLVQYDDTIDENKVNLGMLFVKADDSIDYGMPEINYSGINDKFPKIVMSEDGTHMLLRTGETEIRSYNITTHQNIYNEYEQALQLNAIISCDLSLFENANFNDSLIKTIDDAFYILVPHETEKSFDNYLFYIKNRSQNVYVTKQSFVGDISTNLDLFGSGMFLNGGEKVNINSYYVNQHKAYDISEISAIYSDDIDHAGNHKTSFDNANGLTTSFDVISQFVQVYSSDFYSINSNDFVSIPIKTSMFSELSAEPSVDLQIDSIDSMLENATYEISVDSNGFIDSALLESTRLPVARIFNLNSDAGFNPVYIGNEGRMIINNKANSDEFSDFRQMQLAKSSGAAFELLGPQNEFDSTGSEDNKNDGDYDEDGNLLDDSEFTSQKIHEFYSDDDVSGYAQSFNYNQTAGETTYRYGYSSIVEFDENKDDVYRILNVQEVSLDTLNEEFVSNNADITEISTLTEYPYNRIYMFLEVGNTLYSLIPRLQTTYLQYDNGNSSYENEYECLKLAINTSNEYTIIFEKSYVVSKLIFSNKKVKVYSPNPRELLNAKFMLVHVAANTYDTVIHDGNKDISCMSTPNFMLSSDELAKVFAKRNDHEISSDMIDNHMMVPYTSSTASYSKNVEISSVSALVDVNNVNGNNLLSSGSIVFSLSEIDSDTMMSKQDLPDQKAAEVVIPKSVTTEALNDFYRYDELKTSGSFFGISYKFRPWKIVDLNMARAKSIPPTDIGIDYDDIYNASNNNRYIVQPYRDNVRINQNDSNKYTVSFWRKAETQSVRNNTEDIEYKPNSNIFPDNPKVTEKIENYYDPILGSDHESIGEFLKGKEFTPQLSVQWRYDGDISSQIQLRFSNETSGDSIITNPDSKLEYKSLSTFTEAVVLNTGESSYFDIAAPQHIMVGRTVFYNIPIMRLLLTNVSDDKPKFLMTIMNSNVDEQVSLESSSYALVFISESTPQISQSENIYVGCYVAPIVSSNQTIPPSVSNAVSLSELAFNFNIANIMNKTDFEIADGEENPTHRSLVDANHVSIVTSENKLSTTAKSYLDYENGNYQIRISEPHDLEDAKGFNMVNMKIDLSEMTKHTLKNALLTAHGEVIAYDLNKQPCQILKIFGCSLDRIGAKHVLSIKKNASDDSILTVTQNSGRETALLVNPASVKKEESN